MVYRDPLRKATFSALANAAIHINVRPLLSSERKGQDSRLNPPLQDPCEACAGNRASNSVQTLSRAQHILAVSHYSTISEPYGYSGKTLD
ncbi:hypothetical protein LMH87_000391 [Akanthomyces muscarius]|uniref:Uncharacterized protein n=1 Tax=Akanthomyces muscarius TaxID=2231603 RepID=A0A9W8QHU1_AKAMU|nr:hypothetical protein LMH87_000391 [Akanthomyces muscarius]KAJ4155128.1 hypothetical protein LMH87_000391 [Akanthomyces muscarius]